MMVCSAGTTLMTTYHVARLCILLDIHHRLLLLLLELVGFPFELSLSFLEGALMLTQALRGRHRPAKEGVLRVSPVRWGASSERRGCACIRRSWHLRGCS